MPRGLFFFAGSERCLLSHPDCPHHQQFLRFAFEGVAYNYMVLPFGLSLAPRTFTKCMDAALSPLTQMGIRILNYLNVLAHFGPVGGRASISQIRAPQPLRVPRTQGQFCQKRTVPSQQISVPGNSYQLSPNESASQARTCTSHSAARDFIQTRSPSPSQSVSKDAVPHGLSAFGTSVGPASHEANSGLAETLSSSTCLESRMPPCQGEPGQRCSSGPLGKP